MKVADIFYPANQLDLKQMLDYFFQKIENFQVKNIISAVCPHAGYIYSWQVAAYTYKAIEQNLSTIPKTFFVMSPDHYIWINKILVGNYDAVETPFGLLNVDKEIVNELLENTLFTDKFLDYDQEHAQETQYPFLKYILDKRSDEFKIVPLIFWQVDIVQATKILENYIWKAFFLISSDLSHYYPYKKAIKIDSKTLDILINKKTDQLNLANACGIIPWGILTLMASKFDWKWKLLKYMNSWDTAWTKDQVVGYASVVYKK